MDRAALSMRNDAEAGLQDSVAAVNDRLRRIEDLNDRIGQASAPGGDAPDLPDTRGRLADLIAEELGIPTTTRRNKRTHDRETWKAGRRGQLLISVAAS